MRKLSRKIRESTRNRCVSHCVLIFSVAAVLTLLFLQGCAKHPLSNDFNGKVSASTAAPRLGSALNGVFEPSTDLNAQGVLTTDFYSNGCAVVGAPASAPQLDSRLAVGDWFTERFQEATVGRASRDLTIDERVDTSDSAQHRLRTVGRLTSNDGVTEFTRQCQSTVDSKGVTTLNCTTSPIVVVDESEPCSFNLSVGVSNKTLAGTFRPESSSNPERIASYMTTQVDRGDLTCDGKLYAGVTRTFVQLSSNNVPSLQTSICGGSVLFKTLKYEDSAGHVYYNSRRDVLFHPRFK